jgi:aryl-alcohol dehydrogenase-like predicted oxidoreductase
LEIIDLYQVHRPDPDSEIEEGRATLARLREQGKLRWIGVSNLSVDQMKRRKISRLIIRLQPPYSMSAGSIS